MLLCLSASLRAQREDGQTGTLEDNLMDIIKMLQELRTEREKVGDLGGHLKTGHTWSLQNRPTELTQNKSIYTPPMSISANLFSASESSKFILTSPGRRIRQRRDATGAPARGPGFREASIHSISPPGPGILAQKR